MTANLDNLEEIKEENLRKPEFTDAGMRKNGKCANAVEVTLYCDLVGYDIKTLNTATGKGSYMLKVGQKTVIAKYAGRGGNKEKKVRLTLYKMKGLRGFLRRAAETRLLNLEQSPCCPTAHYPHQEILDEHEERGYHEQGTCKPKCMVMRLYGSLSQSSSIKVISPFIAKPTADNIPAEVDEYIEKNINRLFGMDDFVVYHNGETTLKVETFNIINRVTELAVNNFMKHALSGIFPFKVIFTPNLGTAQELIENIGFFIASFDEINTENGIQLGADKNNGSGRVKIKVKACKVNRKIPELTPFVKEKKKRVYFIEFGGLKLERAKVEYYLDPTFGKHAFDSFQTVLGM